ncbi:MAG: DUF6542 domain-containing protein [Corynebacterium camporealensis]|uniref:DUF6542 domain-containing protein n=1 Tax=Corynebacterium camporealensis TaxID=161896 RepID=UPI002A90C82E|nr:DUF6542 domain-containing protein [Corynebacterium camporealensis]MDY5840466.1 DUF6542 domain-containing protein [Corynebacterium camporealensis]
MSHASRNHAAAAPKRSGLPAMSLPQALLTVVASLLTGMMLSLLTGGIGWPFTLCFIIGTLAATLLVQHRGLFLLVASVPIFFVTLIVVTAWLITRSDLSEGASAFSKTALLSSAFPALEHFPTLVMTVIGAIIIALLRLWRQKNTAQTENTDAMAKRRQAAEADKRNRDTSMRARQRAAASSPAERLSVAELMARRDKEKKEKPSQRPRGSVRMRERDREERRKEQAAHRAAEPRQREPYHPDPNRRAGDTPVRRKPESRGNSKPASRLNDNLYDD